MELAETGATGGIPMGSSSGLAQPAPKPSYRAGMLPTQLACAGGFIISLAGSIYTFMDNIYLLSGPMMLLALFFLSGFLIAGTYEIAEDAITHRNFFGCFRMAWTDVRNIETSRARTFVLHGDNKRFVVEPSGYWSGKQKQQARALLTSQLAKFCLPMRLSRTADFKFHKNVRVR